MKKTYFVMISCLMACMLMTMLPVSGQGINQERNDFKPLPPSFNQSTSDKRKMPQADGDEQWRSLGIGTFYDSFLCEKAYSVEIQQSLNNQNWFRIVQPYHQARLEEGWKQNGTPADDLQFQILTKGESWNVYRETEWVPEPLQYDSLVWFPWRSTGYYDSWQDENGKTVSGTIRISHPGYWPTWSSQDFILHNRVLSYQDSGFPEVVQLAPYYYVNANNLGGWNHTQEDNVVTITFPTIRNITITVNTPGTMPHVLFSEIENWSDVRVLTIVGHINADDMKYFYRMTNLIRLDLSQTDITSITGCKGLTNLTTCILPSTVTEVSKSAFYGCTNLVGINLPNAVTIGDYAFYNCKVLTNASLPNAVTIGDCAFCYCEKLTDVSLPNAVTIGNSAFFGGNEHINNNYVYPSSLKSLRLPAATTIGASAFRWCTKLESIDLPNAVTIDNRAFDGCLKLDSINLPNAVTIGEGAFYSKLENSYSSLKTVILPSATSIGSQAFYNCIHLDSIYLPKAVIIGYDAFSNDYSETKTYNSSTGTYTYTYKAAGPHSINLPEAKEIGHDAFQYCTNLRNVNIPKVEKLYDSFGCCISLTKVTLPASLMSLGNNAFKACTNLRDVYCHVVIPLSTTAFAATGSSNMTLHVPAISLTAYRLADDTGCFNSIVPMEGEVDKLYVYKDFVISSSTGLANPVDIDVEAYYYSPLYDVLVSTGHLTIATPDIHVGTLTMEDRYYYKDSYSSYNTYYYGPYYNTILNHAPITVDAVNLNMYMNSRRWNFISFPFDVNVSAIEAPDSVLWVIRKYSGADRAALTGNTWQNMTEGMTLKAHEGYILHCTNPRDDSYSSTPLLFKVHAVDNANKGNILAHEDVVVPLNSYPSEKAHNRSWNLVGNPYPCFYKTTSIEHQGVITVYNGGYTAYSLLDDDYVLKPFEAFFVQCPVDATSMTFHADGRSHQEDSESSSNATRWQAPANSNRQVYNITLSDGNYTDRARLVVNEAAKMDYETECDASKFMSDDSSVPQLYITDNGIRYAIDERPMGDGVFHLGMRLGTTDEYTIHLQARSEANAPVLLRDLDTGETVDLTTGDYTFNGQAESSDHRFTLTLGEATGITEMPSSITDGSTYSLDGKRMTDGPLPNGIYVVRQNGKATKKVVR